MTSNRGSNWRLVTLAGMALAVMAPGAFAQGPERPWWEAIPGFGQPDSQPRRASDEDPRRRSEVVDDLRPDATPWRSDVMIEAMEGAVERYEAIVSRGGWPMVPGTRMIRPEDDDERVPLLRQRLMVSGELRRSSASTCIGCASSPGSESRIAMFSSTCQHSSLRQWSTSRWCCAIA